MKRKLGIICNCLKDEDPVKTLEKIKAAGFDCFFSGTASVDGVAALKKRADELGLEYEFIHAPFAGINNMWLPGMDYLSIYNGMKTAIDAAAENDVPMVILHVSSGWKVPEINDLGLARFDSLVVYAKERGVKVAFENLRKVGNVSYFVDRYEHMDNVVFCYDCGHEHCYTQTVCFPDIFRERMVCTHIHDNYGRGDLSIDDPDFHLLPFDGNLDFEAMMRSLDKYNYQGSLMLEVGNSRHLDMTGEEFLATCYERIKKISEM